MQRHGQVGARTRPISQQNMVVFPAELSMTKRLSGFRTVTLMLDKPQDELLHEPDLEHKPAAAPQKQKYAKTMVQCLYCSQLVGCKAQWLDHFDTFHMHPSLFRFECTYVIGKDPERAGQDIKCGRRFATQTLLRRHDRCHRAQHKYVCTIPGCSARFMYPKRLREHMLSHPPDPPVPPPTVFSEPGPFDFKQQGGADPPPQEHAARPSIADSVADQQHQQHQQQQQDSREGTGGKINKSYLCDVCGERFSRRSARSRHCKSLHPILFPAPRHPCPRGCGRRFVRTDSLTAHLRANSCSMVSAPVAADSPLQSRTPAMNVNMNGNSSAVSVPVQQFATISLVSPPAFSITNLAQ